MEITYYNDVKLESIKKEHLDSLIDFIRELWDKDMTIDKFFSKRESDFLNNPYMEEAGSPLTLIVENDKVICHAMSTPCKLWVNGSEHLMFWNSGLFLLPESRGRNLGIVLPQKLTEMLPIVTGFFVVPQQLKTHQKLNHKIVGKLPEYMKIVHSYSFFKKLDLSNVHQMPSFIKKFIGKNNVFFRVPFALFSSFLMGIYKMFRKFVYGKKEYPNNIKVVSLFDSRLDDLWEKNKSYLKNAQVRNSKYINWQFKKEDGWIKIIVEENDRISGFAILYIKNFSEKERLSGMKVLSVIDIFWDFDRPEIFDQILNFAEEMAKAEKADLVISTISWSKMKRTLYKNAYLKFPQTVYFAIHHIDEKLDISDNMDDWFMTRGDADAAGALGPME